MKIKPFATAAFLALGLAACGGGEPVPVEPTPVVETTAEPMPEITPAATADIGAAPADIPAFMKVRHDNYEDIGKSMKVLQDNMKLDAPDIAAVTAAATKIRDYAGQMGTWFPAGTGPESGIETEAKANIWTDRATFNAAVTKLQEESTKLAAVTDAAGFKAQFPVTGGACKNCHDTFREEKDN